MLREPRSAGLNLVGYIRAEMGLGEALRGEARALAHAEVPFVIIDHAFGTPARLDDDSWTHKVVDAPHFDTNLLHINADLLPRALQHLPAGLADGRRNIGYWTWELPVFPVAWQGSFSLVDEVWVPSEFVRESIAADAPVPVHVIPHAIRRPPGPFLGRGHFDLPRDAVTFLAMYDTQSVMQRKNPDGAIEAFRRAFDAHDTGVVLALKVNSAGEREVSQLRARVADHPNIRLMVDPLSRHEMDSLMANTDVFVSLHRSEGFGLPIAEAMALGVPALVTGWSGNMDFTDDDCAACVRYTIVDLERSYGPYESGQRWAEPDLDHAAEWMERLRSDPELRRRLALKASGAIRAHSHPSVVGARMAERLGLGPPR